MPKTRHPAWLLRAACAVLLWACTSGAHAASIYKCVGTRGQIAFRDTPCATPARQQKLDVAAQPLIDPGAPRLATTTHPSRPRTRTRHAAVPRRSRKQPMSWECRAADGEVFYRHARCPSAVPGDGVVRSRYAEMMASQHTRSRHDAWGRVRVHGKKIPRAEACRRIRSPSAAGRDGHQRDETVSTYDRLTGHDPCSGA
jgi:hypothetical protein